MTQQELDFRTKKLLPLLIKFSIPSSIAALTGIIYNITDRYFIGQTIGRNGIGALATLFPIVVFIDATGMLFNSGGSSIVGIALGRKDLNGARKILGASLFAVVLIGIVYTILGFTFMKPLSIFLGAGENTLYHLMEYCKYFYPSITFQIAFWSFCAYVRSEGNPMVSMMINLSSTISNVILDYYLVVVLDMGMKGAAIATSISNIIPTLGLLFYFSRSKILTLEKKYFTWNFPILKRIWGVGFSSFLNETFYGIFTFTLNKQLVRYAGEIGLAAMGIMSVLRSFINTSYSGFNQGRQPIISYNWGAKYYGRVKEAFIDSLGLTMGLSVILVSIVLYFSEELTGFFVKNDPELIAYTSKAIHIHLKFMLSTAIYLSCSHYFQAVRKGYITSRFVILRLPLLSIPLAYILPLKFGATGVLLSFPIADSIAAIASAIFMYKEVKLLDRKQLRHKMIVRALHLDKEFDINS